MQELPQGDEWTDRDFPDGEWNIGDGNENNPLINRPDLTPNSNSNCYPGPPGGCYEECYIFTNSVNDAWACAVHQIMNCGDTRVIVFVGTEQANKRQKTNGDFAFRHFIQTLQTLNQRRLFIGVKNSNHYAITWY